MSGNRPRLVRCHDCGGDYYGWSESGLCTACRRKLGNVVERVRVSPFRPRSDVSASLERSAPATPPAGADPFEGL